ncbi:HTH-type transcriptional repressor YtrA [Moorella thermoacetica]|uniref:HTH-type transcriptional repressor YtrA n=1 Tax=Neomoorella thermoacetica TaxID=1525 RepID=A0A1J5JRM3_NEOTH|nr:GntR family transcriptional regulator [Moorella thermoacetica]OIQ09371.1 HTH-type transcriptional repressor YtrA [Moorella thermoacetica]
MLFSISPRNPVPLYQQIVEQIRAKILAGELPPGSQLPSIRELAKELTTSMITTKRAYLELEKEGLLITRPGLGTFVAGVRPEMVASLKQARVKEHLQAAIQEARRVGMQDQELRALLDELLEWGGEPPG